jgi:hypothetical protein
VELPRDLICKSPLLYPWCVSDLPSTGAVFEVISQEADCFGQSNLVSSDWLVPTVIGAIVEPVPSLEMGRVASGRASGIKFLPQHSSFEYQWII